MANNPFTAIDNSVWNLDDGETGLRCFNCNHTPQDADEIATYPSGNCPSCGQGWSSTSPDRAGVMLTMPFDPDNLVNLDELADADPSGTEEGSEAADPAPSEAP